MHTCSSPDVNYLVAQQASETDAEGELVVSFERGFPVAQSFARCLSLPGLLEQQGVPANTPATIDVPSGESLHVTLST